jgi:hypothetical protein
VKRVWALLALQVGTLLVWAAHNERVWATAPTFRIPLQPRDPYDLVRGRYFILNPEDATIDAGPDHPMHGDLDRLAEARHFAGRVSVGFCLAGQVHRVCAVRPREEPTSGPAQFWSTGYATLQESSGRWRLQLDLGLRRFFIPNRLELPAPETARGWELEVCHRPGQTPLPRRLYFDGRPIDLR